MNREDRRDLISLLGSQRWAALATLCDDGMPLASSVAYALAPEGRGFLLHLSRLAEHTRNVLKRPSASLVIGEPDRGDGDPQTLARVSIQGRVEEIEAGSAEFDAARAAYVTRLPHAEPRFEFADFRLLRLRPGRGHFVGGFARAYPLDADTVASVLEACLDDGGRGGPGVRRAAPGGPE